MNIREVRLLLMVMGLGLALAFVVAPRTQGQRGKRHTCRQECSRKYQECLVKEKADADVCEKAFDECRGECTGSRPKMEAERDDDAKRAREEGRAAEKAGAAESNANANANADGGTGGNSNVNGSRNSSAGGSGRTPPPPKKDGKPPATND